ncbi:VirD4-like conjugal transfer protein, CD1115 family [Lactobacillus sp. ESL0681]|uniref:VirD4-like conjugal transfer protein, CD1115 family n=1 Tax=Lactobacillus sp. ESL0681 TaxID=2983211 RepID=UPI0023F76BFE|nr:type IV secretory system conjugative DNA transfer family protein [Lactobacillus sp. ESL0681]WEV41331.1 type IV secretory system conjugative DNA transfer family protein [Lactobacillus sp. ESL0681]
MYIKKKKEKKLKRQSVILGKKIYRNSNTAIHEAWQRRREKDNKNKFFNLRLLTIALIAIVIFFAIWYVYNLLLEAGRQIDQPHFNLLTNGFDYNKIYRYGRQFFPIKVKSSFLLFDLIASLIVGILLTRKMHYVTKKVAFKQKGDSRFTTISELKSQYTRIPEVEENFEGYGGIPISHLGKDYFIDHDTVHNLVIGTSRSGKGQTTILPMLDNLSRAKEKSSLVVNDPKGELFAASSETLKKRGYDVFVLNMADGDKSMAYNPLQLIIKAWEQGDLGRAIDLTRTLTATLCNDPDDKSNGWVHRDAAHGIGGMILALVSYNLNPNNFSDHRTHPERITMFNIVDMISEIGSVTYAKDPEDSFDKSYIIDEYFNHMSNDSFAKKEYAAASSNDERSHSNIYSTINDSLSIFSTLKNAKMTSENTLELKSIGFPKYLTFRLNKQSLEGKKVALTFYDKQKNKISEYNVKPAIGGFVEYNFDSKLVSGDFLEIKHTGKTSTGKILVERNVYRIKFTKDDKYVTLNPLRHQDLAIENLKLYYSEKPVAIFLKIPDSDSSNNALASLFISQLYTELAHQCDYVAGGKTVRRVHFILDEFGNMIPIKDMDRIMTVSAGRNLLFTLVVQSYQQLYGLYGREKGQVIKENCQNQDLIKSTDSSTNEEFSKLCGNQTVEDSNVSKTNLNTTQNVSVTARSQPIILPERVKDLGEGESIVLRALHRQDNRGRSIRAFPIFNTGKTRMPYAWTFLKDFNPNNDPNDLEIIAPHTHLNLKDIAMDWSSWLTWTDNGELLALEAYQSYCKDDKAKQLDFDNDLNAKNEVITYDHSNYIEFLHEHEGEIDEITYTKCLKLAQDEKIKDIKTKFQDLLSKNEQITDPRVLVLAAEQIKN